MPPSTPTYLEVALRPQVLRSALKLSLVVGTLLALINHGPSLLEGSLSSKQVLQIMLTYLVPIGVSTYSAYKALQSIER